MLRNTVADKLRKEIDNLTPLEKQLSDVILQNYPVSGLGSITALAEAANVSTPTVARLVQKLGFSGFPDFQRTLREELDETISSPLTKRDKWVHNAPDEHILNSFTKAAIDNIRQFLSDVDPKEFDRACKLLSDENRRVFVVGGRITRTLADYFFLHLQVTRTNVTQIASNSSAWPHYLLEVSKGDVIVVYDVRRYENSMLRLAQMASERKAKVILFTDQWTSPIAKYASVIFRNRISVPSSWDSNITTMLITEALLAKLQEHDWKNTKKRMEDLEVMFDRTKFFRK